MKTMQLDGKTWEIVSEEAFGHVTTKHVENGVLTVETLVDQKPIKEWDQLLEGKKYRVCKGWNIKTLMREELNSSKGKKLVFKVFQSDGLHGEGKPFKEGMKSAEVGDKGNLLEETSSQKMKRNAKKIYGVCWYHLAAAGACVLAIAGVIYAVVKWR